MPAVRGAVTVSVPAAVLPPPERLDGAAAEQRPASLVSRCVVTERALFAVPVFLVVTATLTLAPGATVDGALRRGRRRGPATAWPPRRPGRPAGRRSQATQEQAHAADSAVHGLARPLPRRLPSTRFTGHERGPPADPAGPRGRGAAADPRLRPDRRHHGRGGPAPGDPDPAAAARRRAAAARVAARRLAEPAATAPAAGLRRLRGRARGVSRARLRDPAAVSRRRGPGAARPARNP